MGSERTGATPGQTALNRQGSIGPAIVSEFNPLDAEQKEKALDNPTIKKTE